MRGIRSHRIGQGFNSPQLHHFFLNAKPLGTGKLQIRAAFSCLRLSSRSSRKSPRNEFIAIPIGSWQNAVQRGFFKFKLGGFYMIDTKVYCFPLFSRAENIPMRKYPFPPSIAIIRRFYNDPDITNRKGVNDVKESSLSTQTPVRGQGGRGAWGAGPFSLHGMHASCQCGGLLTLAWSAALVPVGPTRDSLCRALAPNLLPARGTACPPHKFCRCPGLNACVIDFIRRQV